MKSRYTTATAIIALMLAFSLAAAAQTATGARTTSPETAAYSLKSCGNIQHAIRNYLKALRSDNDGVVESALFYCALLKRDVKGECFSCLKREIDKLANDGRTERIRHLAYLVHSAFENPQLMESTDTLLHSPEELFSAISNALEKTVFDTTSEQAGTR